MQLQNKQIVDAWLYYIFSIQNHIEPLYNGENLLYVRLYDFPGIANSTLVREEELEMVIDGKIKPNTEVYVLK